MKLTTEQTIGLLQLPKIGKAKVLAIGNWLAENKGSIENSHDVLNLLHYLIDNKIVKAVKKELYCLADVDNAIGKAIRIIDDAKSIGIGITTYFSDDFPAQLRNVVCETGKTNNPLVLYYKGNLRNVLDKKSIAIIGTRESTHEGVEAGEYFGEVFAKHGFNIVSGLALGCDSAGHRGALKACGVTTAFLAHGLDRIYPKENTGLAQQIVENGGVLFSEYPIGVPPMSNNFVERDRLQSGLSDATIVVQTGIHGGTMHAAHATLASGKPLFAVRYKSDLLMRHKKVEGNAFLVTQGAHYLTAENASQICAGIMSANSNNGLTTAMHGIQTTMEF